MKRIILFLIISILMTASLMAQENISHLEETSKNSVIKHNIDLGVGLGCDYSGLGIKFSYLPIPDFSLFASGGFAMFDFG